MARSFACRSFCHNPYNGKDDLAGRTPIKGSDRFTPAPTTTLAPPPAVALVVASVVTFGSANSSVVRYLEDDL